MRSIFKFVASLAICGCLLGASAAGAATNRMQKNQKPVAGSTKDQSFLRSLAAAGQGYCQSSCCWASGCDSVSCSDTSCSATCGSSVAVYYCSATTIPTSPDL
jgi:hypothetical protein